MKFKKEKIKQICLTIIAFSLIMLGYFNYSLDYLFGLTRTNDTNYLPLTINLDLIAKNLKLFGNLDLADRLLTN